MVKDGEYVSEIKSLISEFMQYQITPEDIEAWCEDEDMHGLPA